MTGIRWQEAVSKLTSIGYRILVEGEDLVLKWGQEGKPSHPEIRPLLQVLKKHKAEVLGYLRLLQTTQSKLEKPILIESGYLGERLYLVANQGQAREIEESGGICYLPEEVRTLLVRSAGMDEETLKDYLVKIHTTKKLFPGAMIKSEGR